MNFTGKNFHSWKKIIASNLAIENVEDGMSVKKCNVIKRITLMELKIHDAISYESFPIADKVVQNI